MEIYNFVKELNNNELWHTFFLKKTKDSFTEILNNSVLASDTFFQYKFNNVDLAFGSCKVVVKVPDKNLVIKFPIDKPDYCKKEEAFYRIASSTEYANNFAKISRAGKIEKMPYYVMEQLKPFPDDYYDKAFLKGWCGAYDFFKERYGEDYATNLFSFLTQNDIVDIHHFNVGLRDTDIVIFDYSL